MGSTDRDLAGLSGLSLYVPRLRVPLEDWCAWNGQPWEKVRGVVGRSFRMPAPHEDVYTMAAEAALSLILDFDVDPGSVGYLALGTESSKDNAAGAVIVRGMLDRALVERGLPRLSRRCEVPELKHACLGGLYALKGAVRYASCDGRGRRAIVICSDVAEYARGSTGEQTQGAGAVAMLVERGPRLAAVDLARAGSASAYRGPDFRKPMARYLGQEKGARLHDFPVFSGKYSTFAYVDETFEAMRDLLGRQGTSLGAYLERVRAVFMHRPYAHMPKQAMAFLHARALAGGFHEDDADPARLEALAREAGVEPEALRAEAAGAPDLFGALLASGEPSDPSPATTQLAAYLRRSGALDDALGDLMELGAEPAMELGNLYTAALPAWLAAGLEEAYIRRLPLAGEELLCVGYGSGDAAEAIPMVVQDSWYEAAAHIHVRSALAEAVDLDRQAYEALHDHGRLAAGLGGAVSPGFYISRTGEIDERAFADLGVDYYEYGAR